MVLSATVAGGQAKPPKKEKKEKKKKKAADVDNITLETGPPLPEDPLGVGSLPPTGGGPPMQTRATPYELGQMQADAERAGLTTPDIGAAGGAVTPPEFASGGAGAGFDPSQVEPYPELSLGKKLLYGAAAAIPFVNMAAYPFYKQHQEKVARAEAQDERTGDFFFSALEEQPQAAAKLLNAPFVREALTRRYGIDTPEELEQMQTYAQSVGMPLTTLAQGLANRSLSLVGGQVVEGPGQGGVGGADVGDVGVGLPTMQTPFGQVATTPQVVGAGETLVGPGGQQMAQGYYARQEEQFKKDYKAANPKGTDLDADLAYMYAHKGQVPFDVTAGGNRIVKTNKWTGAQTIIDGVSLRGANIEIKEFWDGNEMLGWIMIDKDTMTSDLIRIQDIMDGLPPEEQLTMREGVVKWARENLPKEFSDVLEALWHEGAKVAGQRKGPPSEPKKPKRGETEVVAEEKDEYDLLLEGE